MQPCKRALRVENTIESHDSSLCVTDSRCASMVSVCIHGCVLPLCTQSSTHTALLLIMLACAYLVSYVGLLFLIVMCAEQCAPLSTKPVCPQVRYSVRCQHSVFSLVQGARCCFCACLRSSDHAPVHALVRVDSDRIWVACFDSACVFQCGLQYAQRAVR